MRFYIVWMVFLLISVTVAFAETRTKEESKGDKTMGKRVQKLIQEGHLGKNEEKLLLKLSRDVLETHVRNRKMPDLEKYEFNEKLEEKRGVFVTLKKKGRLRGCIGYIEGMHALYKGVIDNTVSAAEHDPRFKIVQKEELDDIDIEISVMTPLRQIQDIDEIVIGKHGLVLRKWGRAGLLLPQVPIEQGWDRDAFLEHICIKAGLPSKAWEKDAELSVFSAQVFGEEKYRKLEQEEKKEQEQE